MDQFEKKEKLPFEDEEEVLREARRYFEEEAEKVGEKDGNIRTVSTIKANVSYLRKFEDDIREELINPDKNYPTASSLFEDHEASSGQYGRVLGYLKNLGMIDTWGDGVSEIRWDLTEIDDEEKFSNKLDALADEENLDYIVPDLDVETPYRTINN